MPGYKLSGSVNGLGKDAWRLHFGGLRSHRSGTFAGQPQAGLAPMSAFHFKTDIPPFSRHVS
jgi:hypothetical protein